ncbi:MAG: RNA 2',3'-cyclic phosphodiesterase [Armatimonadota bacterium]|nr:RNA 2',3'-cyclic phosphodiesterase [Armatimonadota bacterium]
MRLFIAALVSEEVRHALATAQAQLQRVVPERALRWVAPENYHITLLFLGEQPEERLPEIITAMTQARAGIAPFRIQVQGIGVFPNWNRPSVLWAGAKQGTVELTKIAVALEQLLLPTPADKPFHPHITLARFKTERHDTDLVRKRLFDAVQRLLPADFGTYELRAISLMQSTLTPDGSIYTELERVEL